MNRSSAYKADDPAVDIHSEADGSAVDILRCIRMRIQSTTCIYRVSESADRSSSNSALHKSS